MQRRLSSFILSVACWSVASISIADAPDFGLMLNDDGDYSFVGASPAESVVAIEASVDALQGTPVRTLIYCVGAGSDTLYYPTQIASVVGWRKTKSDELADPPTEQSRQWSHRIANIRAGMSAGVDPIRVAGERARKNGLYFVPTYRMNDNHFIFDPLNYPLTGKFWLDNHERLEIGESPIASDKHYGKLLDYSHPEVRGYRLAVIKEIIERYADIMNGIELDFNRVQVLFPRAKAQDRAHLVTELIAQVRKLLDAAEARAGRKLSLLVRVPPTLHNCTWAGLDIRAWMEQRLVDVLLPSQLMTLAQDMPVDEFVTLAKPAGCRVCPSLYPRTSWGWDFVANPKSDSYESPATHDVSPGLVRGSAANYWQMGAAGFELFNFHHEEHGTRPFSDRIYRILRDLAGPGALNQSNKVFAITPAYYLDHEDTYENRKQIPVSLTPMRVTDLTVFVGDDVSIQNAAPRYCGLRFGLQKAQPNTALKVMLNGTLIHNGALNKHLTTPLGRHPVSSTLFSHTSPASAPDAYAQFELTSLNCLRPGNNKISVTRIDKDSQPIELVEVTLGVFYDREYLKLLLGE